MVHHAIDNAASRGSMHEVIQIKKKFNKLLETEKASVLTKFVENKEILKSLYDLMFAQKKLS